MGRHKKTPPAATVSIEYTFRDLNLSAIITVENIGAPVPLAAMPQTSTMPQSMSFVPSKRHAEDETLLEAVFKSLREGEKIRERVNQRTKEFGDALGLPFTPVESIGL
jgi:hypothetical protein